MIIMCFVLCVCVFKSAPRKKWSERIGRQHDGLPVLVLTGAEWWK